MHGFEQAATARSGDSTPKLLCFYFLVVGFAVIIGVVIAVIVVTIVVIVVLVHVIISIVGACVMVVCAVVF